MLEEQRELKRSNIVANELKSQKEDLEQQSNAAMMEFVHQKEENIAYRLKLQEDDHLVKVTLEQIVAENSAIAERKNTMMQMEEDNYELTIFNH